MAEAWHSLKRIWPMLCLTLLPLSAVSSGVVINEVCYDPVGADSGHEWIELYNAGDTDVNLEGALLLSGGSSYSIVFEFPHYVLRARRFVLIGESQVANAMFTTSLGFQNGGAETDGIRFVSPDGDYTDTVLYDSPNTNGLLDDTGAPGEAFAPDVPEGYSLARIMDGLDTDDCAADWLAESDPTPSLPNRIYVDYALLYPETWQDEGDWIFGVWVKNLSHISPQIAGDLRVLLDGIQVAASVACDIPAGDSLQIINQIPVSDSENHLVEAILELPGDPDTSNNQIAITLWQENLDEPILNEVMYDPDTGKQEWIELWIGVAGRRADYYIQDAADNEFSFSLPPSGGYFVLCSSPSEMIEDHPGCPPSALIETDGWAALNNDGDTILLFDSEYTLLDQMTYAGVPDRQGVSLERHLSSADEVVWRYSLDASGSTPGIQNSQSAPVPDFEGSLKITGSPCGPRSGEAISIFYKLDDEANRVNCRIFDRVGHRLRILADDLAIPAEGALTWDGRDEAGKYVPRGLYFILWESRPASGGNTLRRQLEAAIYD